jgi:enoyl-CoA hydratase/carnithine racemase
MLPRIIGQGRAAELLYSGRMMPGDEAYRVGFYNELHDSSQVLEKARERAGKLAAGPTLAHAMTKRMLREEWDMDLVGAIEAEARMQAGCMETNDFRRAYDAFVEGRTPRFEGD